MVMVRRLVGLLRSRETVLIASRPICTRIVIGAGSRKLFLTPQKASNLRRCKEKTHISLGTSIRYLSSASAGAPQVIQYKLSDIGEGITVGDQIKAFDRICEVQSDKATVEISSRYDGVVSKIYHEVNAVAKVGHPLIDIRVNNDDSAPLQKGDLRQADQAASSQDQSTSSTTAQQKSSQSAAPSQTPSSGADGSRTKALATPAVRAIAKEKGLDLSLISGSGRDGRIMKEDVLRFLEGGGAGGAAVDAAPRQAADGPAAQGQGDAAAAAAAAAKDRVVPVRGYMRAMVKTMQAQVSVPHMGLSDDYHVDGMIRLRESLKEAAAAQGVKLTYTPVVIKAMSLALGLYPEVNARFSPDMSSVVYLASHNIGIAIDTPTGLVVPNIKGVQGLSILDIAAELARLVDLARASKLANQDLAGGTMTISNIGAIGGTYAAPILMPGEAIICALGAMSKEPRYDAQGNVQPTTILRVSYSADHRLLAGATVGRFSNAVKGFLNDPATMLLHLR